MKCEVASRVNMGRQSRHLPRVSVAMVFAAALVGSSTLHCAEVLHATKIFGTEAGALHGLAFDEATDRLYTVERATTLNAPQLRAYSLDGTLVSGPHALTGTEGALTRLGLHFLRGEATIGGESVPAGSLVMIRDRTLYVLDKTDGAVIVREDVSPDFDTGGLCTRPLNAGGKGLGYSTRLGRFLTTHSANNCSGVVQLAGGEVTGFIPAPVPASSGAGDAKENPLTGRIWVGNAPAIDGLTVFSGQGALLREFEVLDAEALVPVGIMRLCFDSGGERLWLLGSVTGDVYQIDVPLIVAEPVPILGPFGAVFLVLALLVAGCRAVAGRPAMARG